MTYYKRIREEDLPANYVDGSVLLHTDMNKLETLAKEGINANYEDIQKLQDGTITIERANTAVSATTATSASMLGTATLSKSTDEDLQNSDEKISTSKQVKEYVDSAIANDVDYTDLSNKPQINGVTLTGNKSSEDLGLDVPFYYFDGQNTAENVAMFNEICDKFDDGEKFILVGKIELENGYTYQGEFHERTIPVLTPFNVKNFTDYEEEGETYYSFMTEPVRTTGGYAMGSVKLTGTWGNFTAISPITWSYDEGPVKKGDLATVATSGDYTDLSNTPTIPADRYLGMVSDYNSTAKALNLSSLENGIYFLGLSGGSSAAHYYQDLYVKAGSRTGSITFEGKVGTLQNDFGIVILDIFNHKSPTIYQDNEPIGFIQTPSKIIGNSIYINNKAITYGTNYIRFVGGETIRVPSNTSDLTNDGADGSHPFIANYDNDNLKGLGINNGRLSWLNGVALTNVDVANYSDLPTNTSDLTNDGADGTHPFIPNNDSLGVYGLKALTSDGLNLQYIIGQGDTTITLQDKLVSGTNIKTINNTSLLGSGNIDIQGGSSTPEFYVLDHTQYTNNVLIVKGLKKGIYTWDNANSLYNFKWDSSSSSYLVFDRNTPILYILKDLDDTIVDNEIIAKLLYFRNGFIIESALYKSDATSGLSMSSFSTFDYVTPGTTQTISGIKTFSSMPKVSNANTVVPTDFAHLTTKKYVDNYVNNYVDNKMSGFTELHLLEYQGNDYRVVSMTGDCNERGTYVWDDLDYKFELQFSDSDSTIEINTGFCGCFVIIKSPDDVEDGEIFGYIPWFYNSTDGEFQFVRLQRNSLDSSGMTLVYSTTELATVTYVDDAITAAITTTLGGSY